MKEKLWKVTTIVLTDDARRLGVENVVYAYHAHGMYLPASGKSGAFSWTIPARDLESPQYDLTETVWQEAAASQPDCDHPSHTEDVRPDCGAAESEDTE